MWERERARKSESERGEIEKGYTEMAFRQISEKLCRHELKLITNSDRQMLNNHTGLSKFIRQTALLRVGINRSP